MNQGPATTPPVPGSPPTVTGTSPVNAATGTPLSIKVIVMFSTAMNPFTISGSTFMVKRGTTPVAGTVSYSGITATFTPSSALGALSTHTATITTGAKDTSGRALAANFVFSFTTGALVDTTPPLVSFTSPTYAATGTPVNAKVLATFSKAMDATTITTTTFTLKHATVAVPGSVTFAGTTATFVPTDVLAASTVYTATITTGVKDTKGHPLAVNYVWGFTTGLAPDTTPPRVSSTSPVGLVAVNSSISAMFSEVMDPATISASTFTLKQGTDPVSGVVSYAGFTATFDPSSDLAPHSAYTATIAIGAKDLAGNGLANSFVWTFTTGQIADITPPRVSSTSPLGTVPVNSSISAMFSESMDPLTITTSTFMITQGLTPVSGLVTFAGFTATFDPISDFAPDTPYIATITSGVRDLAGNALANSFIWNFRTGHTPDTTPPLVSSTSPTSGVAVTSSISATFNEAMDPTTITVLTFLLAQGATSVSGLVTYAGFTATLDPSNDFAASTTYTATITIGAKDLAGNALQAAYVWNFTTGATADTTPPLVASTSPLAGATDTAVASTVSATFNEAMDPTTVTVSTFLVTIGTTPVSGLVTFANMTATFTPSSFFGSNSLYTANVTTGVKDLAGNALASDFTWNFTTLASPCAQLTVDLASASGFAVLAGATVTNTGSTSVTGDLGVSPGTSITGFPPGTVVGTIHYTDTASASGIADLTTAYNDAAARTLCPVGIAGDIGGQTLTPGLYKSTSGLAVTSSDLTLDALGDASAVFIFQIASTLDVADGKHVILAGGANAANIFWQVGTSATFGTTSDFKGTVMADQSITLNTGATLEGRALARIAAVALDSNVIVKP